MTTWEDLVDSIPDVGGNLYFYLFRTLNEVREITERWLNENNSEHPR